MPNTTRRKLVKILPSKTISRKATSSRLHFEIEKSHGEAITH